VGENTRPVPSVPIRYTAYTRTAVFACTFAIKMVQGLRTLGPMAQEDELARKYYESNVCRYHLCGLCPHELFTNTKIDMGSCTSSVCQHLPAPVRRNVTCVNVLPFTCEESAMAHRWARGRETCAGGKQHSKRLQVRRGRSTQHDSRMRALASLRSHPPRMRVAGGSVEKRADDARFWVRTVRRR
jgi:hypothetical protein